MSVGINYIKLAATVFYMTINQLSIMSRVAEHSLPAATFCNTWLIYWLHPQPTEL